MRIHYVFQRVEHISTRCEVTRCYRASNGIRLSRRACVGGKEQVEVIQIRNELLIAANQKNKFKLAFDISCYSTRRQRTHIVERKHVLNGSGQVDILWHYDKVCVFIDNLKRKSLDE